MLSREKICQDPTSAKRRDPGSLMASTDPFVTNPINVSHSHSHSRSSGGRTCPSPPQNLGLMAQFHCGAMKLGIRRCFSASDSFATPFLSNWAPCFSHSHILTGVACRGSAVHSTPHLSRTPGLVCTLWYIYPGIKLSRRKNLKDTLVSLCRLFC